MGAAGELATNKGSAIHINPDASAPTLRGSKAPRPTTFMAKYAAREAGSSAVSALSASNKKAATAPAQPTETMMCTVNPSLRILDVINQRYGGTDAPWC